MTELPSGTVTFLFTDIEGSTKLLHELGGPRYAEALAEHQRILRGAFAAHHGREVDTQGDSFFVAFRRAKDAVAAAVDAQRDLAAASWPAGTQVKVRMGLHTGEPQVGEERYVGLGVHKAARIGAAGHGGQVLLSRTTRELVEDEVPPGVAIRDLGERRLKDLERPEHLSQLVVDGLPSEFGPLHTLDVELKRRRRRMYAGSALIGVLAAAVAIPVFALGQGGAGSTVVAPNSVALIDASTNEVVSPVTNVGLRPGAVAFGEGAIWVANLDERSVTSIDPDTADVVGRIPLDATPTGIAAGGGSVWVAFGQTGTVSRIDPSARAVIGLPISVVTLTRTAGSVALGEGGVWVAFGSGTVARIDASAGRVDAAGAAGVAPASLATGAGSVWVANAGDSTVSRLNPRTIGVIDAITVGPAPRAVAFGDGSVWVVSEDGDEVWRIDPGANSIDQVIEVGAGPNAIAFDEDTGLVWVANGRDGTISRIDATTNSVEETIAVGNRPSGVAVGNGKVWVTIQAAD
jgi:YVTN family beta-propeller protein